MSSSLKNRYLESISTSAASLSLMNISRFYYNYVRDNKDKVHSQIERVGYYVLKNKVSTGSGGTNVKDIYISAYFVDVTRTEECNRALSQKYHSDINVESTGGFFVPSTNELVIIVQIRDLNNIEKSIEKSDIRSTIEHELTHAFDHTSKKDRLANQKHGLGVGENFLMTCAYFGCAKKSEIGDILDNSLFLIGNIPDCLYAISVLIYKLFTITEFNAHQMSDLEETHNVDIKKSNAVRKALLKDITADCKVTTNIITRAGAVTPDECPQLWTIVGRVLDYMGYHVNNRSPEAVYKFFISKSVKLFKNFYTKKMKNQVKYIISIKEKENIKNRIIDCIDNYEMSTGVSFWFSPIGKSDSYLCRIKASKDNKITLTLNHKPQRIYGNVDAIYKRAIEAYNSKNSTAFKFAIDNLVDVIVQSLERVFNDISYDPVYDITIPQDEEQISSTNKIANRYADLDWD